MTARTVLITGVGGFIGSELARRLTQSGDTVIGTDLNDSRIPDVVAEVAVGDIRDPEVVRSLCRRASIDQIVHCGGISGRRVNRDDPRAILDININGTINVVEAARECCVPRIVFLSSGSVYGRNTDLLVSESAALAPVNSYGATKVSGESIINAYANQWELDGVSLRVFQAYGPGRMTRCNIRTMVEAWSAGKTARLENDAQSRCQYVYIDDVVDGIIAALNRPGLPERAYNISGERSLTMDEIADIARTALPGLKLAFADANGPSEYALRDIDLRAAKRDLGYSPKMNLHSGIERYARVANV